MPTRSSFLGTLSLLAVAVLVAPLSVSAQDAPTFNADVGPILYENCAECHRQGEVAPMVLTSYQTVRPWARSIKAKVVAREMPPWLSLIHI